MLFLNIFCSGYRHVGLKGLEHSSLFIKVARKISTPKVRAELISKTVTKSSYLTVTPALIISNKSEVRNRELTVKQLRKNYYEIFVLCKKQPNYRGKGLFYFGIFFQTISYKSILLPADWSVNKLSKHDCQRF